MNININDVLNASKLNGILNFKPGLVGGHCIGVDPYYLYYKAKKLNLKLDTIKASRNINEKMPSYIFNNVIKIAKIKKLIFQIQIPLIIGAAHLKKIAQDIRNSGSIKLAKIFKKMDQMFFCMIH